MTASRPTVAAAGRGREQTCVICGAGLDVRRVAHRVCDSRRCQRKLYQQSARAAREQEAIRLRERAERVQRLEKLRDRVGTAEAQDDRPALPIVMVPANTLPLLPLPDERREKFREHLRMVIALASVEGEGDVSGSAGPDEAQAEPDDAVMAALGQACATCRGHCCQGGGEHAYLDVPSIRRFLASEPGTTLEMVLERYMSYVPEVSYEGSCVFHAETGCALPRHMRSIEARRFYCEGLREFQDTMAASSRCFGFVVAMDEEFQVVRTRSIRDPRGGG